LTSPELGISLRSSMKCAGSPPRSSWLTATRTQTSAPELKFHLAQKMTNAVGTPPPSPIPYLLFPYGGRRFCIVWWMCCYPAIIFSSLEVPLFACDAGTPRSSWMRNQVI
jgi:hypothetical protein